jgi:DNA-binding transcriptional MerR regulator
MAVELTISEISKEYGVTYRALRYYEEEGLLSPRRDGKERLYDDEVRSRVKLVLLGKSLGFSLAEIKDIVNTANTIDRVDFRDLLSDQQILEQIEFLERRREEINQAIEILRLWRRPPTRPQSFIP